MTPRIAVTATFLLNGAVFSAWYARLPASAPAPGIAAFALMGLGLAAVFPLTLRAAGAAGAHAAPDLAAVSALGYTGFLAGPPLIGLLAELGGLTAALAVVPAGCLVAAVLAGRLERVATTAETRPATETASA